VHTRTRAKSPRVKTKKLMGERESWHDERTTG
jgi:hypothetical protein